MFFNNVNEIKEIAQKCETAIFVVPDNVKVVIKNAIILAPDTKSVITIEQVREVISRVAVRQTSDCFVVISPADKMSEAAANAFLKCLEQPNEKVHFVLITVQPTRLLSTILSRARMYYLRKDFDVKGGISTSEKVKDLAKKLMVARPADLVAIADEICKKKDGVRSFALEVVGIAIEMLYKTYFLTSKEVFLQKLPKFLAVYDGISQNGHVKLQIVANLC